MLWCPDMCIVVSVGHSVIGQQQLCWCYHSVQCILAKWACSDVVGKGCNTAGMGPGHLCPRHNAITGTPPEYNWHMDDKGGKLPTLNLIVTTPGNDVGVALQ